ncbi:MAG TPA: rhodanese-like domain-containing protein [Bacteroidota bacterium]|nr:rhodanese-like domain-containing protein [Bacteroidota bacterium]
MDSLTLIIVIVSVVALFIGLKKFRMRGIPQYSPEEARQRIREGAVLLDVRTPAERKQTSIAGSLHIPLNELSAKMKTLERNKSREIIVYCASGNRSGVASVQLKKAGFNVANLQGGIGAWNFSNL